MMDIIEEQFNSKEKTLTVIRDARSRFRDKSTTAKQYDGMISVLGFCFLYCPDDMQYMVEATLYEAGQRQLFA